MATMVPASIVFCRSVTKPTGWAAASRSAISSAGPCWKPLCGAGRLDLALALANERCALKPTSPQNWRIVARVHIARGNDALAQKADARRQALMAA